MTIKLKLVHNEPSVVKLFTHTGELALQATLQAAKNQLDLGRLKAGSYIMHISNSVLRQTTRIRIF